MTRGRLMVSLALVALVGARSAAADDRRELTRTAARLRFEEGLNELAKGDHTGALAAFDASNRLLPSPNAVLYMARCFLALGRTASAHAAFLRAYHTAEERIAEVDEKRYIPTRDAAEREAAAIEADVAKVAIVVPPGSGEGLVVLKNGVLVPESSWGSPTPTDPGHVTIDVTGHWLIAFHEELDLARAETRRVEVRVERLPTAVVRLKLPVVRPEGLEVRFEGYSDQVWNKSLEAPHRVDAARCIVDVSAPGYIAFHWAKSCTDGEVADVDVRLVSVRSLARANAKPEDEALAHRVVAYALGGAAVVGVGVGTYFGLKAKSTDDEAALHCPTRIYCDDVGVAEGRDAREQATLSTISFVAAAALLTSAVVVFVTAPSDPKGRAASVRPAVGVSGAGLQLGRPW